MKYIAPLLICIINGCAPWPTTSQPDVDIVVTDASGQPIRDALIKFAIYKIALSPEVKFVESSTDDNGNFHLEKVSYIQMVALAPDGGHSYDWSYCIQKQGYQPIIRNSLSKQYFTSGTLIEPMSLTSKKEKCSWQEYPHGFITKP
jgi:hypothetical protein